MIMLDLTAIPDDVRLARGDYATVRAAHEDAKKLLSVQCGSLSSIASQVLKRMQPDSGQQPEDVSELIFTGRNALDAIEATTTNISLLSAQREELRGKAWPK